MTEPRKEPIAGEPIDEPGTSPEEVQNAASRAQDENLLAGDAEDAYRRNADAEESSVASDNASALDAEREARHTADDMSNENAGFKSERAARSDADADTVGGDAHEASASPRVAEHEELPSAAAYKEERAAEETQPYDPVRDEQDADALGVRNGQDRDLRENENDQADANDRRNREGDAFAALQLQTPVEPEKRGNRGAGILISLLATVAFAVVYAAALFIGLLFNNSVDQLVGGVLLDHVVSPGFIAACGAFLLGMLILVLLVGRAGWWAYVLGGFWVAALVWAGSALGYAYTPTDGLILPSVQSVLSAVMQPQSIIAAFVAREVTVWFGAWIGARGRRVTRRNKEAEAEYQKALEDSNYVSRG